MTLNGGTAIVDALERNGVSTTFVNPGSTELHTMAALNASDRMRVIPTLFEGVASGAADGYGRLTRKPAAALLHLEAGLAYAWPNLHNAAKARTPLITLVGQNPVGYRSPISTKLGPASLAESVSKQVFLLDAESIDVTIGAAVELSTAHPQGVVTICVPSDTTWSPYAARNQVGELEHRPPKQSEVHDMPADVCQALSYGGDCTVFVDGGWKSHDVMEHVVELAQTYGSRLLGATNSAWLRRGLGAFEIERLSFDGAEAARQLAGTKALVVVGSRTPRPYFASAEINDVLHPNTSVVFWEPCPGQALRSIGPPRNRRRSSTSSPDKELGAMEIGLVVSEMLPEGSVLVNESISASSTIIEATQTAPSHEWLDVTGGAIGMGIPLAVGAAIARPDARIVVLVGDGSALYTPQALWTAARERLNITVIVLANRGYKTITTPLSKLGDKESSSLHFQNPEVKWSAMASTFGVPCHLARSVSGLRSGLASAFRVHGPAMVECLLQN